MPWRPENFVDMLEIIGLLTRWSASRTRATLNALHFLLVDFGNWIGMQSGRGFLWSFIQLARMTTTAEGQGIR